MEFSKQCPPRNLTLPTCTTSPKFPSQNLHRVRPAFITINHNHPDWNWAAGQAEKGEIGAAESYFGSEATGGSGTESTINLNSFILPAYTEFSNLFKNPSDALNDISVFGTSLQNWVDRFNRDIQFWKAIFTGRPRLNATIQVADTGERFSSPVIQSLAAGARRLYNQGIPLSSPAAGPIFGKEFNDAITQYLNERQQLGLPAISRNQAANLLSEALGELANPSRGDAAINAIDKVYRATQKFNRGQRAKRQTTVKRAGKQNHNERLAKHA